MTQEHEPFLLHEKDNPEPALNSSVIDVGKSLPRWINWKFQILAHGVLITIYTVLSIAAIRMHSKNSLAPRRKIHGQSVIEPPFLMKPNQLRLIT